MPDPERAPERAPEPARRVAAFDPGRNVGFALVDERGAALRRAVLTLGELAWLELPDGAEVIVGAGTGRRAVREALAARGLSVRQIDETGTSLAARDLWRRTVRARGLARLLPAGLRAPPGPIDDFAAWAIALRYLGLDGTDG
jgi:hypothetical protein